MGTIQRRLTECFFIDANRINARGQLTHMNQLEAWRNKGLIQIEMPEPAQQEAARGSAHRANKTFSYVYAMAMAGTAQEQELIGKIEQILFPSGALAENEKNDVDIVFIAHKYDCILVTADGGSRTQPGGILGHRAELGQLGAQILTDQEAVELVRKRIAQRDERVRLECRLSGLPLPSWVGND